MTSPTRTIHELIRAHAEAKKVSNAFDEEHDPIYEDPGRPEQPSIQRGEFPAVYNMLDPKRAYSSLQEIDVVVERYKLGRERLFMSLADVENVSALNDDQRSRLEAALEEGEKIRQQMHALFNERQAAYDAWAERSGWKAAYKRSAELYDVVEDLDTQIQEFPSKTLDDLSAKAAFVIGVYDEYWPRKNLVAFLAEAAALYRKPEEEDGR